MIIRHSKIARMMTKNFEEIGAALLDDPRLSANSHHKLTNFLKLTMADLRMVAGMKDDASLFDVMSFIVDETCSEIVGLTVYDATPFIVLTYPEEESDEEFLDDSDESALNDHLASANFLEHQQRKEASDIGLNHSFTNLTSTRMKIQIHGTTLVDQEDTSDAPDDNDVLSVAFDDNDLPATGMENQQRKDVSDIGFTPSMTTLTLPWTTNQKIGTTSPTSTTTPTMFAPSHDSYDLAVRTVTFQVKFNNSSSKNLIKYYEHEHDDYNGNTIHHKNENDTNSYGRPTHHHSSDNLIKFEHENDVYDGSTTHHSSNENLTNYYENDSGDGYYSNLDDYYLDDLHYLSDGSDGSVEI